MWNSWVQSRSVLTEKVPLAVCSYSSAFRFNFYSKVVKWKVWSCKSELLQKHNFAFKAQLSNDLVLLPTSELILVLLLQIRPPPPQAKGLWSQAWRSKYLLPEGQKKSPNLQISKLPPGRTPGGQSDALGQCVPRSLLSLKEIGAYLTSD